MTTSTLSRKNQTTIPKSVVDALGLGPSASLVYEIEQGGRVILTSKNATFASLAGTFPRKPRRKARSGEEIGSSIRQGAARRLQRSIP